MGYNLNGKMCLIMLKLIDNIVKEFRPYFKNPAAFCWFSIIITGFIVRFDHHGVSSFIRCLFLDPNHHEPMVNFFRAKFWRLGELVAGWIRLVLKRFPVMTFNGRLLIIWDGIKVCKEAKKMPAVKRLHQDSDNSGKGEYIDGHHLVLLVFWSEARKKTVLRSTAWRLCRNSKMRLCHHNIL